MRVLITRRPPVSYELTGDSLLPGRIYDLPSEFAGALVIEGCAEFADHVPRKERRQVHGGFVSTSVHDWPTFFERRRNPAAKK